MPTDMDLWTNFWCITLKEPNYSGVWWPMTDGLSGQFWTFPHQPRLCRLAMVNPWSEPFVATQRRPSILAVGGPSGCPQPIFLALVVSVCWQQKWDAKMVCPARCPVVPQESGQLQWGRCRSRQGRHRGCALEKFESPMQARLFW